MSEYIAIGSCPTDEDCAQVGAEDYERRSRLECRAYKEQLERTFPGGRFGIKTFPHEFGTYREVVAYYSCEAEAEIASRAETHTPATWDAEARAQLDTKERDKKADEQAWAHNLTLDEIEAMMLGSSDVEAMDGCHVEPDGRCPYGYRSPLLILGVM